MCIDKAYVMFAVLHIWQVGINSMSPIMHALLFNSLHSLVGTL